MSHSQPVSHSAALTQNTSSSPQKATQTSQSEPPIQSDRRPQHVPSKKRSPSPSHVPQTGSAEASVYVLTLMTDRAHHDRMTALRNKYFPKHLNKLAAHLTLFHALPRSKLESSIMPLLEDVASRTSPFRVSADKPFRMKKGFAVSVSEVEGRMQGKNVHRALQGPWQQERFLSTQDAGGCRLHYTLMNKVDDDRAVEAAYAEFLEQFKGDMGTVEGLALWKYDRGFWKWDRSFAFTGT